jgi:hypothetical protein
MGFLLPMAHRKFGASACGTVHGRAHSKVKPAVIARDLEGNARDHMRAYSHHRRVKTPHQ